MPVVVTRCVEMRGAGGFQFIRHPFNGRLGRKVGGRYLIPAAELDEFRRKDRPTGRPKSRDN